MKMEQIECSETSAYKIQTPGNHPEGNIQHTEHGESLKSKILGESASILPWKVTVVCVGLLIRSDLKRGFCVSMAVCRV
jgi:hypothetical protein